MSETGNLLIFNLAAHFAKRNTKNCGSEKRSGESEGGQKFIFPTPLFFCPPERSVLVLPPAGRQSVEILFKMSSDFFQQTPPKGSGFSPHRLLNKICDLKRDADFMWTQRDSNSRPSLCHRDALPTAPWAQK